MSRWVLVAVLALVMCSATGPVAADAENGTKANAAAADDEKGLEGTHVAVAGGRKGLGLHSTLGGRFSGDVQEFFADVLLEPWQSASGALLVDVRGMSLDTSEQEASAGIVWRSLLADRSIIAGLNAFYDTRWTDNDNRFDQAGGGIELLSRFVDLRANYYFPLQDEEPLGMPSEGMVRYEEALDGFDVELGGWIPFLQERVPTGIFAGYYDFSSDYDEDISGMRARVECRVHSYVTLDAQWFEDTELNETDYFAGFRIHIPLGCVPDGRKRVAGAPLESRLYDMVIRDFRIRTRETGPVPVRGLLPAQEERGSSGRDPVCELDSEGNVVCW